MVKPSALLYIAGPYVHDYYNPCQRTCNTTGVYGVWRKENIMRNKILTLAVAYIAGKFIEKEVDKSHLEEWEKGIVKLTLCPIVGFIIGLIGRKVNK